MALTKVNSILVDGAINTDASGNVGIGTSSPRVRLDVRSDAVIAAPTPLANAVTSGVFAIGDSVGSVMGLQLNGSSYDTYIQARNMGAASTAYNLLLNPLGGNVGIGTSSPSNKLQVTGSAGSTVARFTDGTNGTFLFQFASSESRIQDGGANNLWAYDNSNQNSKFFTNGSERMRITSSGNMFFYSLASGAGTNALKWSTATGQMTYDTSSARYKDNIRDSIYGLNHVMQMRSAQFEYKDDGRSDVGLIAEELQPIVPELVGLDKDGQADSVSYDRMVSVLVKAVQEQQAIITDLKARIETLEAK